MANQLANQGPNQRRWKCPICRREVGADEREFPFCSRRCRTQDLANWASGKYVIHEPLPEDEEVPPTASDDDQD